MLIENRTFNRGSCRGLRYWSGYEQGPRLGLGLGRGMGYRCRMFFKTIQPVDVEDEKEFLRQEAEFLQNQLDSIKKRLSKLEESKA